MASTLILPGGESRSLGCHVGQRLSLSCLGLEYKALWVFSLARSWCLGDFQDCNTERKISRQMLNSVQKS